MDSVNLLPWLKTKLPMFLVVFGIGGIFGAENSTVSDPLLGAVLLVTGAGLFVARKYDVSPV